MLAETDVAAKTVIDYAESSVTTSRQSVDCGPGGASIVEVSGDSNEKFLISGPAEGGERGVHDVTIRRGQHRPERSSVDPGAWHAGAQHSCREDEPIW